jgi:hypothetical protein
MVDHENSPASDSPRGVRGEDAVFLGWQRVEGEEALPLYTITAMGHPSCGSTVTDVKLRELDLQIPHTPPPQGQAKKV